jgi:addiction module HigA family antidote
MATAFAPVTLGELLLEEFLLPMGISKYRLAEEIGVPAQRIGDIVAGKRSIPARSSSRTPEGRLT